MCTVLFEYVVTIIFIHSFNKILKQYNLFYIQAIRPGGSPVVEWSSRTALDQEVRGSNLGKGKKIFCILFSLSCLRLSFEEVSRKDKKNDEKNSIYRKEDSNSWTSSGAI